MTLCISSSKFNSKNFWNGRWRSTWKVSASAPGSVRNNTGGEAEGVATNNVAGVSVSVSVTGSIAVNAHYYEEGNVQMNSSRACDPRVLRVEKVGENEHNSEGGAGAGDAAVAAAVAAAVVKAVRDEEKTFLEGLTEFYEYNNTTTYKELRRMLPVTRTKFQWDQMSRKLALALRGEELAAAASAKSAARERHTAGAAAAAQ